jgi:GMP synthase-like glutamine amidotransferase
MPSCLIIQHAVPEPPFAISDAMDRAGIEVVLVRTFADDRLPDTLAGFSGLVVMGGPMSASSDENFATRSDEVRLMAEALDEGVPTLGVCLGAQMLALAGGGEVVVGEAGPEVGWARVYLADEARADPLFADLPSELTVLHWHEDTYRPPATAVTLASSDRYDQQAFRCGTLAWGMQFHVEVDLGAVEGFLAAFPDDPRLAGTTAELVGAEAPSALAALERYRTVLLDRFAALVAGPAARRDRLSLSGAPYISGRTRHTGGDGRR